MKVENKSLKVENQIANDTVAISKNNFKKSEEKIKKMKEQPSDKNQVLKLLQKHTKPIESVTISCKKVYDSLLAKLPKNSWEYKLLNGEKFKAKDFHKICAAVFAEGCFVDFKYTEYSTKDEGCKRGYTTRYNCNLQVSVVHDEETELETEL